MSTLKNYLKVFKKGGTLSISSCVISLSVGSFALPASLLALIFASLTAFSKFFSRFVSLSRVYQENQVMRKVYKYVIVLVSRIEDSLIKTLSVSIELHTGYQ